MKRKRKTKLDQKPDIGGTVKLKITEEGVANAIKLFSLLSFSPVKGESLKEPALGVRVLTAWVMTGHQPRTAPTDQELEAIVDFCITHAEEVTSTLHQARVTAGVVTQAEWWRNSIHRRADFNAFMKVYKKMLNSDEVIQMHDLDDEGNATIYLFGDSSLLVVGRDCKRGLYTVISEMVEIADPSEMKGEELAEIGKKILGITERQDAVG